MPDELTPQSHPSRESFGSVSRTRDLPSSPRDLSVIFWCWLPGTVIFAAVICGAITKNFHPLYSAQWRTAKSWYEHWFHGEAGIIELATFFMLVAAAVIAVMCIASARRFLPGWISVWITLLLLGTVYFAGEEVSWGQHLLGWETPQWYLELSGNRQKETNLHNTSGWFNQKPRLLFQIWVLVGGVLLPLYRRQAGRALNPKTDQSYWFWPTSVCILMGALAILVRMPEWITSMFSIAPGNPILWKLNPVPPAEAQEYCLGAFLFVYFASLYVRIFNAKRTTG